MQAAGGLLIAVGLIAAMTPAATAHVIRPARRSAPRPAPSRPAGRPIPNPAPTLPAAIWVDAPSVKCGGAGGADLPLAGSLPGAAVSDSARAPIGSIFARTVVPRPRAHRPTHFAHAPPR
ncbi:MAG: hypothetical protein U1A27_01255 [Phycisphaerae bacterium]